MHWSGSHILHALLLNVTAPLWATERKHFTVSAMLDQLEAIKANRNLATEKCERRYKLTNNQQKIFHFWKIDKETVDNRIAAIDA